ncbi:c-type cytochrome [Thalassospiraceae bacterium LMO-SO8]|nr:c-type cytochrome [Alphaproteobacteria bacterium LMO-S08]WND77426.1 c-type cytochrome [Thalassospiraceae bacterium LMO-SO8]
MKAVTAVVAAAATWAIVQGAPLRAANADDISETELFTISRGGQIYDNWMSALEADKPSGTHPAYPPAGKQKGASTWRCKECHGWDYKGKDGAYAKGSHATGIKGLRSWDGGDPDKVVATLRGKLHGYTPAMISDSAARKLALFVTKGQIEMDTYIDRATKKAKGDIRRGAGFYQTICSICHGVDGRAINFKEAPKIEYIGTVAQANPWETLHKIRNGQPGIPMVALSALSVQDQVDILAYSQTLPAK